MITDREELEKLLKKIITVYAKDRKVVQKVTKELNKKNVLDGDTISLFKLNTPLTTISLAFLFCFTKALFEATHESEITPTKHFTKLEIEVKAPKPDFWKEILINQIVDPIFFE
jgi:hypothetical protein